MCFFFLIIRASEVTRVSDLTIRTPSRSFKAPARLGREVGPPVLSPCGSLETWSTGVDLSCGQRGLSSLSQGCTLSVSSSSFTSSKSSLSVHSAEPPSCLGLLSTVEGAPCGPCSLASSPRLPQLVARPSSPFCPLLPSPLLSLLLPRPKAGPPRPRGRGGQEGQPPPPAFTTGPGEMGLWPRRWSPHSPGCF